MAKQRAQRHEVEFLIDHIDPLGQGVYKAGEDIFFIPKTLPDEAGVARVLKSKGSIHFCALIKLDKKSPKRLEPACSHFHQCRGCDFLHTSYEEELRFKENTFKRMLAPIGSPDFETLRASSRLGYRNRIQLHYDVKSSKLGFIDGKSNRIQEVPRCKIIHPSLEAEFQKTYQNWKKQAPAAGKKRGHIELYLAENHANVQKSWNQPYAAGGFTQVNSDMNEKLLASLKKDLDQLDFQTGADLFGGDGNLGAIAEPEAKFWRVDRYPWKRQGDFHSFDLFSEDSIEAFAKASGKDNFDLFLVDPPRAGFRLLNSWARRFNPKHLVYVSCHPPTMIRDIQELETPFEIKGVQLLDLFPGTRHFEAKITLSFS